MIVHLGKNKPFNGLEDVNCLIVEALNKIRDVEPSSVESIIFELCGRRIYLSAVLQEDDKSALRKHGDFESNVPLSIFLSHSIHSALVENAMELANTPAPVKPDAEPVPDVAGFVSTPKSGQVLLYALLPKKTRDAVLGDLSEDYDDAYKRFGLKVARRMYWWVVIRSLFPILEAFIIRTSKWAGTATLGQMLRHFVK